MCGRYVLKSSPQRIRDQFRAAGGDFTWPPRYNLAPQQLAPVVRVADHQRRIDLLRWGLIPSWAKGEDFGYRTINARGETLATLPVFRSAFRARRAIVPADAFYEWQEVADATQKQPYCIHRRDGAMLAMAGLWEFWRSREGDESLETFTIITTDASRWMAPLHNRMPAILDTDGVELWLNPRSPAEILRSLLRPAPEDALDAHPVSRAVGNPRNEGAELAEPVDIRR